jgi:peptide/nickel transport system ATP-binding protein
MRQRVMIAMALAARPKLLIADEPTTALDVTIQAQILGLMKDLQQNTGMGILFITHDLGVVNQIADRVYVMYAGRVMEEGHRTHVFDYMAHPYTRGLFASLPSMGTKRHRLQTITGSVPSAHETVPGCPFHPRCLEAWERCHTERPVLHEVEKDHASFCHLFDKDQSYNRDEDAWTPTTEKENTKGEAANDKEKQLLKVNNLKTHFPVKRGLFKRTVAHVRAVDDISFTLPTSHTIALVGESGCGKTTAGLSILRLIREATGSVVFNSDNIMTWDRNTLRNNRKNLQIVFQDPFSSLSPRLPVGKIVQEGLDVHFPDLTPEEKKQRVIDTLQEVGLSPDTLERYPHEFSGGQRQRISLARAFVLKPAFLVLDEPTSALDVSVQAQILNLLKDMQQKHHITYLFITHDLAVVRHIADTAAVMYLGKIVEYAPTDSLFKSPQHPYSRSLLKSIPRTDTRGELARLEGEVPSPLTPPQGCYFHPRCTLYKSGKENGDTALCNQCISAFPPLEQTDGHHTACYAVARETKPTSPLNSMES